ncbi:hypothetical protein Y032_0132g1685 [Ancylostoma ceylanicum]|uniref:UPAR/Ly6 domain-containing protein n=1 Tax=Ancylostoma ceylanicum TaxID=53326 RepID=A0A016T6K2_9BILA|nr:hypothetical protein Y032_0132g1685 [Ancylostoma ceylanicum]
MRHSLLCTLLLTIYFTHSFAASNTEPRLLTCMKCLGNDTACRNTCAGYYCYKIEIEGAAKKAVKRGCLNDTDALSRVNECTLRKSQVGGLILAENVCICTSDRCNSSSNRFLTTVTYALLTALFGILS